MQELQALTDTVRHNCNVSDARHAGFFSICGLALRLRDLYKWENDLDPWIEKDTAQILDWIEAREKAWESLAEAPYEKLPLKTGRCDPFEVQRVNSRLIPEQLLYGALYARGLKPMFFLAAIEEKRAVGGLPVYVLGNELARDLMTAPALTLDDTVIVRKSAARLHLWDQIAYLKKSGRTALEYALSGLGLSDYRLETIRLRLPQLLAARMDTYIYHEVGEIRQTVFKRDHWRRIIAAHPQTTVELLARAGRDLLADTHSCGPLRRMIETRNRVGLALYTAFCDGVLRELFPEIRPAFAAFARTEDWGLIDIALEKGRANGQWWTEVLVTLHTEGIQRNDPSWARGRIEALFAEYLASRRKAGGNIQ